MTARLSLIKVSVALAFVVGFSPFAHAQGKVEGAIWEITWKYEEKGDEFTNKFRATNDGKVWNVPEKGKPNEIGSWTKDKKENVKIVVDKAKKGGSITFDIIKVGTNPDTFQGNFENNKGVKGTTKVKLLKD